MISNSLLSNSAEVVEMMRRLLAVHTSGDGCQSLDFLNYSAHLLHLTDSKLFLYPNQPIIFYHIDITTKHSSDIYQAIVE